MSEKAIAEAARVIFENGLAVKFLDIVSGEWTPYSWEQVRDNGWAVYYHAIDQAMAAFEVFERHAMISAALAEGEA